MTSRSILLVASAITTIALGAGCSNDPVAAPAALSTTSTPSGVPDGYTFSRHGSTSELTRVPDSSTVASTTASAPPVGIGDAMVATRLAKPIAAQRGDFDNSVKVTFECATGVGDTIDSIAYELRDHTLVVSASVSGSVGDTPCGPGQGPSIELPLDSPWVEGTTLEAGELPADQN